MSDQAKENLADTATQWLREALYLSKAAVVRRSLLADEIRCCGSGTEEEACERQAGLKSLSLDIAASVRRLRHIEFESNFSVGASALGIESPEAWELAMLAVLAVGCVSESVGYEVSSLRELIETVGGDSSGDLIGAYTVTAGLSRMSAHLELGNEKSVQSQPPRLKDASFLRVLSVRQTAGPSANQNSPAERTRHSRA